MNLKLFYMHIMKEDVDTSVELVMSDKLFYVMIKKFLILRVMTFVVKKLIVYIQQHYPYDIAS